ncbi:MAG TPA: polysaccharide deacetylase family protein [Xanthobacteraceae bacterium]|nr:polysaccharide deacetylase family protein [Xanthobacteraceae bacterium]
MRVVVIVCAALLTVALAAFGIVAAHKTPAALVALTQRIISPAQATVAAATAQANDRVNEPAAVQAQVIQAPVIRVSDTPAASEHAPPAASPAPLVVAQNSAAAAETPPPAPAPIPKPVPAAASTASSPWPTTLPDCHNPDALGMSRIVQIDTTGGPAFGTEHFKQYDFLREKEVVLTFDDGPWPQNTEMVLKALQDNCVRATFFEIGEHATWAPQLTKELVDAGMTVGTHTWSHKDLAKNPYAKDIEQAKQEIEMGVSAVHMAAAGGPVAPFFRFPDLQMPADLIAYLGTRNIATFSTDIDTFDFKIHKPEDVVKSVMTKLAKNGKGILLMHDFQHGTAEAMPEILHQLHLAGYKVVGMVPKFPVTTIPKYDDMVRADDKYSSSNNTRPENSVIKTISN